MQSGDAKSALALLGVGQEGSYGQPVAVVGPDGKQYLAQYDKNGNQRMLGAAPVTKANDELAKIDAKAIDESRTTATKATSMLTSLNDFDKQLKNTSSLALGPLAGKISPYLSSDAQKLQAPANQISLLAKELLGMPSNNFSDADREFLINATVGLGRDKNSLEQTSKGLRALAQKSLEYNKYLESTMQEQGSLSGAQARYNEKYLSQQGQGQSQEAAQQKPQFNFNQSLGQNATNGAAGARFKYVRGKGLM